MIYFFPYIYKDETFYSLVSRYRVWSGNTNSKALLRELYGKESVTASKHLPSNFIDLKNNLPSNYEVSIEEFINKTTLYKYYLAFSDYERANIVFELIKSGDGSRIFSTLGLSNNNMNNKNNLKYCKECIREDKEKYGEAYWHREHQISGILICDKHNTSLFEVLNEDIKNRQEFININHFNYKDKEIVVQLDEEIIKKQISLINNSRYLLNDFYVHKNKEFFRDYYINKLVMLGIADGKHKVNQDILHKRFIEFYGHKYLQLLGCDVSVGDNNSWLTKITRKHRTFFHPLYHLLMIDFLGIDIKELFNSREFDGSFIRKAKKDINEINLKREKWLTFIKENPDSTTTEIRSLNRGVYDFLYRYDKEWLRENSPKRKRKQGKKDIDWEKRDEEVLKKVKDILPELLDENIKPIRITRGLIGRKIGEVTLIQKKLDNIPKSKELINNIVESIEDYQKRRVAWVKNNCFNNEIATESKVKRKAGIKNLKHKMDII